MNEEERQLTEKLRRYVRGLRKHDELGAFFDVLNEQGAAYLFGGAARDVAFGARQSIHDLDIFVSGTIDLERVSRFSVVRRNNFGGLRLYVARMEVDAWELQKSYPFVYGLSRYVSVMSLLRTVCFSTDGVAVALTDSGRAFRTPDFVSSLVQRQLNFVVRPAEHNPTVATRIARLVLKLNLGPSPSVARYFIDCVGCVGMARILAAEKRWGKHQMLNDILLEQVRSKFLEALSD